MAAPSLTYTLTNGTTADATQVMQNFSDLLNGITDGTKDLSINALTAAGTATLNGHVNLGNSSADDLTITASLASTLPIKTNTTYDIGSVTKGLNAVYIGGTSTFTGKVVAATLSASRVWTVHETGTDASFVMTAGTQSAIAGTKTFTTQLIGKGTATNDDAVAGYIGEYKENNRTSTIAVTSATYFSVDTGNSSFNDGNEVGIILDAGDWDIQGTVFFDASTNAVITQPIVFIGTGKGTSTTGQVVTKNYTELNVQFATSGDVAVSTPVWRVSIASQTTYYLKARCSHSGGSGVTASGCIKARRPR